MLILDGVVNNERETYQLAKITSSGFQVDANWIIIAKLRHRTFDNFYRQYDGVF